MLGQSNIEKAFTFIFTCTIVEWRNEKEIKNMETNKTGILYKVITESQGKTFTFFQHLNFDPNISFQQ